MLTSQKCACMCGFCVLGYETNKSASSQTTRLGFFWEKRRLCLTAQIVCKKDGFWQSQSGHKMQKRFPAQWEKNRSQISLKLVSDVVFNGPKICLSLVGNEFITGLEYSEFGHGAIFILEILNFLATQLYWFCRQSSFWKQRNLSHFRFYP